MLCPNPLKENLLYSIVLVVFLFYKIFVFMVVLAMNTVLEIHFFYLVKLCCSL